jgi:hypothetical protein
MRRHFFAAAALLPILLAACLDQASYGPSPEDQAAERQLEGKKLQHENELRQQVKDDRKTTFAYCYSRLDGGVNDCKFKKLREVKRALTANEERDCEHEVMPKPCQVLKAFVATGKELPLDLLQSCEDDVANRDEACACRQEGCSPTVLSSYPTGPENLTCFGELGDELCHNADSRLSADKLRCIFNLSSEECDRLERNEVENLLGSSAQR